MPFREEAPPYENYSRTNFGANLVMGDEMLYEIGRAR